VNNLDNKTILEAYYGEQAPQRQSSNNLMDEVINDNPRNFQSVKDALDVAVQVIMDDLRSNDPNLRQEVKIKFLEKLS
jgi:hypothetical protein